MSSQTLANENLKELMELTKLTEDEINEEYSLFVEDCPSGTVSRLPEIKIIRIIWSQDCICLEMTS